MERTAGRDVRNWIACGNCSRHFQNSSRVTRVKIPSNGEYRTELAIFSNDEIPAQEEWICGKWEMRIL